MNRKKAVIYPYDNTLTYFFRHSSMIRDYEVIGAVSPNGWGYTNKDVGSIDGGENLGILVKDNFDKIKESYDTVIITDTRLDLDFEGILYPKIKELVTMGKSLVIYRELSSDELEKVISLCENNHISLKLPNSINHKKATTKELLDINTPIIFVLGLSSRTQKFEIQLSIRDGLIKEGYRISQIGTKNHCELFGFHSFPQFMFENNFNDSEKVIMFNRLVKNIELSEKPDAIIIGIPGGILAVDKYFTNGFGILAYLISQAVKPDFTVFSTLYNNYYSNYFEDLNNLCTYRFGYPIGCFNISNVELDMQELKGQKEELYTIIDSNFIDIQKKKYDNLEKSIFNILNRDDRIDMINYIVRQLTGEEFIEEIL